MNSSSKINLIPSLSSRLSHIVPGVALTPEVESLISRNCPAAISISGGKDSVACALAVMRYLDSVGHSGERILVHSDLGRVEWKDSIKTCTELAEHLGLELMVVGGTKNDLMDRWKGRWKANLRRFQDLSCVKVILPWSTPALRFCTSEKKNSVIASALKKRFPDKDVLNITGIRREESANRKKMPVSAAFAKLKRRGNVGITWNAIIEWTSVDVFSAIAQAGLRLHEAYTVYGNTRVSCTFCIMSNESDLMASARCEDNQALYVEIVELEAESTFAFQNKWLADVRPDLLSDELRQRIVDAKEKALRRQEIEAQIPKHLLYSKGWPACMPTLEEAGLIASIRKQTAELLGIVVKYTTAESVLERYAQLIAEKALKEAAKAAEKGKKKRKKKAADEGVEAEAVES